VSARACAAFVRRSGSLGPATVQLIPDALQGGRVVIERLFPEDLTSPMAKASRIA
jgi:hypothetical protein